MVVPEFAMKTQTRLLALCALVFLVAVPVMLAQDSETFGLSQADFDLLAQANSATAAVASVQFDFTANATISGVVGVAGTIDLNGNGAFLTGANPSLDLIITGDVDLESVAAPFDGQFRIVDGVLYFNIADPTTGELAGWASQPVQEISDGLVALLGAPLASAGLGSSISADLGEIITTLQPHQFVGIQRQADTDDESHFVLDVNFDALIASSVITDLLTQAAALNPNTPTPGQLTAALADATFHVEQWIGTDDQRVHRAVLNLNLPVESASGGQRTSGSVALDFDISLRQFDEAVTIAAPEGMGTPVSEEGITQTFSSVASSEPLAPNVPLVIELTGQGAVDVVYNTAGNETVSITARSIVPNTIDPTLEVLDPDGRTIAFNDDHATAESNLGAFDSAIPGLPLAEAGAYTIRIGSYNNSGMGQVEVLAQSEVTPTTASAPISDAESEVVTGSLTADGTFAYSFTALEGEMITLAVRDATDTLDPRLLLVDSQFNLLAENDDHESDDPTLDQFDSKIEDFVAPAAGTYNLLVSDFAGAEGAFQLVIIRGGGRVSDFEGFTPVSLVRSPSGDPSAIVLGSDMSLNLDGEAPGTRTFYGAAGQEITITARAINPASPDVDVYLSVFGPSGSQIAFNDDHGTGESALGQRDAQIRTLTLPTDGAYRIEVDSWFDLGGEVAIQVEEG
jgi:hypothetical protein